MSIPFGKDAVLYYSSVAMGVTAGTDTAADLTWVEYDNVRDVSGNYSAETVDVTTRATAKLGWSASAAVLNTGEVTLNIPQPAGADTTFDAILSAWENQTEIALMVFNGAVATSGNQGLASNFSVSLSQAQPVKDVQSWDVTLTVSSDPEWYKVP